jgi:hypothetical protein
MGDPIVRIHENDAGFRDPKFDTRFLDQAEGSNDDDITRAYQVGSSAIDTDIAGTLLSKNGVRF